MRHDEGRIDLATGVTLPYLDRGDADGTPVVLLHGIGDAHASFAPCWPFLPSWLRVIAPTQRGHGDASKPAEDAYRLRHFANDLGALLDALGLESAWIAGHSMGAAVALRFALDAPSRTRGLFLISGNADVHDRDALRAAWREMEPRLHDPIDPDFLRGFLRSAAPEAWVEEMLPTVMKAPARVWHGAFGARLEQLLGEELHRIRAPALLLWGEEDGRCPPAEREALLTGIRGAHGLRLPHGLHEVHLQAPAAVAFALAGFVAGGLAAQR